MDHYVYLDETGTLDFEAVEGERYFGVGTAHWRGEHSQAIWQGHHLRLELEAAGVRLPRGLHAKHDSPSTRAQVFRLIAEQAPRLDATMLLKSNAQDNIRSAGKLRLYKMAVWLHLKHVVLQIYRPGDRVFVIAGHLQTSGHRDGIRIAVADVASQLSESGAVISCIWEAPSAWGIQVADYMLWRVQREDAGRAVADHARVIDRHIKSRYYPWNGQ